MTPRLETNIKKVKFSQDKYRASLVRSVQEVLRQDEFVLADTYGRTEYFIVTTRRLLICRMELRGIFGKQHLGGLKHAVLLERVTSLTTWSEPRQEGLWQLMDLQVETFDGDFRVSATSYPAALYYKDPNFFLMRLQEAVDHESNDILFYDEVLYRISLDELP